ncbi:MAG: hypothetical protein ABI136_01205 [Ginsengibacter sp.]
MASNNRGNNNNPGTKEMVLAMKIENPHQFLEPGAPLPIEKQKRKISPVLITILILISAAFAFYWAYSGDNNSHLTRKGIHLFPILPPAIISKRTQSKTTRHPPHQIILRLILIHLRKGPIMNQEKFLKNIS